MRLSICWEAARESGVCAASQAGERRNRRRVSVLVMMRCWMDDVFWLKRFLVWGFGDGGKDNTGIGFFEHQRHVNNGDW